MQHTLCLKREEEKIFNQNGELGIVCEQKKA